MINAMAIIHPGGVTLDAQEKVRNAELSERDAQAALLLVAKTIRDGKPLPMGLDDWLASAIESAINTPGNSDVGHALLVGLGLRSNNRRKTVDWLNVGQLVQRLIDEGMKKTPAIKQAAKTLGIGYGTAQSAYVKFLEACKEHDRVSSEEVEKPPHFFD